jgi:hypothetical protein
LIAIKPDAVCGVVSRLCVFYELVGFRSICAVVPLIGYLPVALCD